MCALSPVAPQISHLWLNRIGHNILSPLRRTCARYTCGLSPKSKYVDPHLFPFFESHFIIRCAPLFKQNPQWVCVCFFGTLAMAMSGSIPTLRFSSSYLEGPVRYDNMAENGLTPSVPSMNARKIMDEGGVAGATKKFKKPPRFFPPNFVLCLSRCESVHAFLQKYVYLTSR